jgi:hypothetical protein
MKTAYKSLLIALALVAFAAAQKPKFTNAKVQELSAAAGLKSTIDSVVQKQTAPLWIGYRIPSAAKERTMCCFDWSDFKNTNGRCCGGCKMESEHGTFTGTTSDCSPEPLPYAFVFLRAEAKQIGKVRVYSPDCALDFAGLDVYWLEGVNPEQSVDFLFGLATMGPVAEAENEDRGKKPAHQAVMAIALHDVPAADMALEKLIQPGRPLRLRENVAFWLGVERGKKGLELLRKYVKGDSDEDFRAKGTFAFSQSKEPGAVQDLISMARTDSSSRVRGQAIFWMSQIGGRKVAEQITEAIENDPETSVKKKAVFALSQLHDGEGVPLLINVAKTNKNPAVRKQAIFWLGQSHDPRALDYLEQILTR